MGKGWCTFEQAETSLNLCLKSKETVERMQTHVRQVPERLFNSTEPCKWEWLLEQSSPSRPRNISIELTLSRPGKYLTSGKTSFYE
jgi:hypothetical protein